MRDLRRPVARRTTRVMYRGRRIVTALLPGDVIEVRLERCRTRYTIGILAVFERAAYLHAMHLRVERQTHRAATRMLRHVYNH